MGPSFTSEAVGPASEPVASAAETPETKECAAWYAKLDEAIDRSGVRDGEAYRVPGFPHLRVNRFLASFRQQAAGEPNAFAAWEKQLRELDARTHGYEIRNLPQPELTKLGANSTQDAIQHASRCASALKVLTASTEQRQQLAKRAQVPDDYIDWKRDVGLYPAVSKAFFEFAKKWQSESAATFEKTEAGSYKFENTVRYQPAEVVVPQQKVTAIVAGVKADALGIPQYSDRDRATLFAAFAPIFEIETSGDYDKFGPLRFVSSETPEPDISRPTVYRRLAFTRMNGRNLTQLVYMIWFPERPQDSALDPLSGKLDGIIIRATLDETGRPLVYDTIHNCGCYHMFFPTPRLKPIPPPDPNIEWAFIPRALPAMSSDQRLLVRVTTRAHYVVDARPDTGGHGTVYAVADEGELRTLPTGSGTRSTFGPNGIVPGTDRGERLVTWSLGIESAGAMREWGRHATALVGRRHFDEADLIEQRFQLIPAETVTATADQPSSKQRRVGALQ